MQKTIFAVTGPADCGKNTVIKMVASKLLGAELKQNAKQLPQAKKVVAILEISGAGKITVGIQSEYDPISRTKENLELFAERGCQVIICARRTRGKFSDAPAIVLPDYKITPFDMRAAAGAAKKKQCRKTAKDIVAAVNAMVR